MKKPYIVGAIVIIAALCLAMFSFKSTLTSYVTIKEAKAGRQHVQVAGNLVTGSTNYDINSNALIFKLQGPDGDEITVNYSGSKPANFDDADKIVVVGKYDNKKETFIANELLVKCPSKYEGRISEE